MNDLARARLEAVRNTDPDRYLAALTATEPLQSQLIALYAFANEIARVREVASDPMVGAIRLQWWRETVQSPDDADRQRDPVAAGITMLLGETPLATADLLPMIDARERDLEDPVIGTWDDMDAYCDQTAGLIIKAALNLAGTKNEDLALAAGRCWGIAGLVRAFPFHAGQGRIYFPAEAFDDVELDPHGVLQGQESQKAFAILFAATARAQDYWTDTQSLMKRIPKQARCAVSYVTFYDFYVRQLRSKPGEAFLIHPEIPAYRKQMKLMMGGLI